MEAPPPLFRTEAINDPDTLNELIPRPPPPLDFHRKHDNTNLCGSTVGRVPSKTAEYPDISPSPTLDIYKQNGVGRFEAPECVYSFKTLGEADRNISSASDAAPLRKIFRTVSNNEVSLCLLFRIILEYCKFL